jgi:hypothetical protein
VSQEFQSVGGILKVGGGDGVVDAHFGRRGGGAILGEGREGAGIRVQGGPCG